MSDLLKMKRLVDGDDMFAWRVEAACWQVGVEYSHAVVKHVAANEDVLDTALMDEEGTIDSSPVPDTAIVAAVGSYTTE